MKYKPKGMVKWYDPRQLSATGTKSVLSSLFGNFSDKREIMAALEINHEGENPYYDYSDKSDLWVDYVADLGDGFDSTHSVAWLMAQEQLEVKGLDEKLPRAKVIVMGGDQVYPTPERDEYEQRFKMPYASAFTRRNKDGKPVKVPTAEMSHLYALPGNHDWYDGLTNFLKVFCQQRTIGNLLTRQHRSYFAIKLPHNVWIWGIDVALSADIDKPQRDYFELVTKKMQACDKVILCTPEPAWVYQEIQAENESFDRLNYFINRFITHGDCDKGFTPGKHFELLAVISGDLHHYSRYEGLPPHEIAAGKKITDKEAKQYDKYHCITAGGGGAFMHMTHNLPENILDVWYSPKNIRKGEELTAGQRNCTFQSAYPSKKSSKGLSWRNFLFPFINWEFTLFMAGFQMLLIWFIQSTTRYSQEGETYFEQIYHSPTFDHIFGVTMNTIFHNPILFLIMIVVPLGLMQFSESNFKRSWLIPKLAGLAHGLAQILWFFLFTFLIVKFNYSILPHKDAIFNSEFLVSSTVVLECIVFGGLVSSFMMGIYLFLSSRLIGNHDTEASSSILSKHYKNFMRIHVTEKEVCIYPIGVEKVHCKWEQGNNPEVQYWTPKNGKPEAAMIEKECIRIPLK